VTEIDALIYATGKIITCGNSAGPFAPNAPYDLAGCSNKLTIKGMMMAKKFALSRMTDPRCAPPDPVNCGTSPAASNKTNNQNHAAEFVSFNDSIYTNTPPGFSDLSSIYVPPVYIGEKKPRY
jgi:hypothetical protein